MSETTYAPSIKSYKLDTVADLLSCTKRHVEKEVARGELVAYKIGQRGQRITHQSLEDYIQRRTRKA